MYPGEWHFLLYEEYEPFARLWPEGSDPADWESHYPPVFHEEVNIQPIDYVFDSAVGHLYFSGTGPENKDAIWRSRLREDDNKDDNTMALFIDAESAGQLAVDEEHRKLYWAEGSRIFRADTEGNQGIEGKMVARCRGGCSGSPGHTRTSLLGGQRPLHSTIRHRPPNSDRGVLLGSGQRQNLAQQRGLTRSSRRGASGRMVLRHGPVGIPEGCRNPVVRGRGSSSCAATWPAGPGVGVSAHPRFAAAFLRAHNAVVGWNQPSPALSDGTTGEAGSSGPPPPVPAPALPRGPGPLCPGPQPA